MDIEKVLESQEGIRNLLKSSYENDRLSHAYLFYGEKGVGKIEMAFYFATFFYCPEHGCLKCHECNTIINNQHMNVHLIQKQANKTVITVDQIEELQEEFSKTSLVDGPRIYIVDGIDEANPAAQNKLLKFIEEPDNKEATYGIFIAENMNKVLTTIKSRCALVPFPVMDKASTTKILIETLGDVKYCYYLPYLTNNITEACEMYKNPNIIKIMDLFESFMDIQKDRGLMVFLVTNQAYFQNSDNLAPFMKLVCEAFSDVLKAYMDMKLVQLKPLAEKYKIYMTRYNYNRALENLELALKLERRIKSNVAPKNIFNQLMVNLCCEK